MARRWSDLWRGTGYLLAGLGSALVTLVALPLLAIPVLARGWAGWHQERAGRLLSTSIGPCPGLPRDLAWLPVHVAAGGAVGGAAVFGVGNVLVGAFATPLWWLFPDGDPLRLLLEIPVTSWGAALVLGPAQVLVFGGLTGWLVPPLARAHARLCLAVLSPSALAKRVEVLTTTRAGVLDAHGAELRRIERDLHDGTQARLVAIALRLGVARESLTDDPELVARLLKEAHEGAEDAMTELRGVIRTMYPPILADRGLAGAVTALATGAGVPTAVEIGDLGEVPAAVEAAAYFVAAEALTNAARHAHATSATVRMIRTGGMLTVEVTDDGAGGADETRGTGITGIRHRAAALDGSARISSPAGGPTVVTVELPCGS
ncbi:sensor histidine kinase [Pseudonocardia sp. DSM 110487]|uniref:sensor histidine kinase n=1 Tax=Pseudonocardia sp. DSM 110487 TaxID=2865833 RepID=UPI001C6A14A9|nr:histidine kinase [Pseudonocardia sp. DSM 110487]QYN37401.1 sensor histidine kinase [Pseudonocardia sp. DSM 110487]